MRIVSNFIKPPKFSAHCSTHLGSSFISPIFFNCSAWKEHEENGCQTGGFLIGLHHIKGQLLDELLPQVILDELRQRGTDAIGPQDTQQEESVEGGPEAFGAVWAMLVFQQTNVTIRFVAI